MGGLLNCKMAMRRGELQSSAHHPGRSSQQPVFAISCRRYKSSNVNKYTVGTGQYGGTVCAIDEHEGCIVIRGGNRSDGTLVERIDHDMTRMTRGGAISNDPYMTDQGRISVIDGQSGECWIDREAGGRCTDHGTHDDMMQRMSGLGHRNQQVLNTQQEHARRNEERKARNSTSGMAKKPPPSGWFEMNSACVHGPWEYNRNPSRWQGVRGAVKFAGIRILGDAGKTQMASNGWFRGPAPAGPEEEALQAQEELDAAAVYHRALRTSEDQSFFQGPGGRERSNTGLVVGELIGRFGMEELLKEKPAAPPPVPRLNLAPTNRGWFRGTPEH